MTQTIWIVDLMHSQIRFNVSFLESTVTGLLTDYNIIAETKGNEFEDSRITFTARAGAINTGNKDRDNYLRSRDFLDIEDAAEIRFESTSITLEKRNPAGASIYSLEGNLTIKQITKPVALRVEFKRLMNSEANIPKAAFTVWGEINRNDFELTWDRNSSDVDLLIGENVMLVCDIQMIKGPTLEKGK